MTIIRLIIVLIGALAGGCATVSPACEARCATFCAQLFPEMSISKDDGKGLCRCLVLGDPIRHAPTAFATVRYPAPQRVAGR